MEEERSHLDQVASAGLEPPTRNGEAQLDILVSVGTGKQTREDRYPNAFEIGGLKQVYLSFIKAMDTEATWDEFKNRSTYNKYRHHRLNVPLDGSYVGLDDWKSMHRIERAVHDHLQAPSYLDEIVYVVNRLVASLLLFELNASDTTRLQVPERMHRVHGQISCRLQRESDALIKLTDQIRSFWFYEESDKYPSQKVTLTLREGWKSEIRTEGKHLALPITIRTMDPDSRVSVAVTLEEYEDWSGDLIRSPKETTVPISGFPISFTELRSIATAQ